MRLLLILNGSLASQTASIGGGDLVMHKFIRLSGLQPDILVPASAESFVQTRGRRFLTASNLQPTVLGILVAYAIRMVQGVGWSLRNRHSHDIVLAASPFGVDLIPLWFWQAPHKGAVVFHVLPERKAVSFSTRLRFGLAALEQRVMLKIMRRACDFIVAGNDTARRQLEVLLPGKPISVLDAGFDAGAMDREPAPKKDANLACFVGRLTSQKGIFDLLEVMMSLARTHPDLRLAMVGTGPERDLLLAEIQKRGVTSISLLGFIGERDKIELLKRSTYFFFPSYEEGWGIALAEALYGECRCICYGLPHYRAIFGDFPSYARLGDPADFVRAFTTCPPVTPAQKDFLRRYDDKIIATRLKQYLLGIACPTSA